MSVQPVACPKPPVIEGYLYKMKRKTTGINLTGSWNKRWFYVDTRRKEFGYSLSDSQPIMKNSIFLDDITAVVSFDDYCFQIETKTRKFFLKGESKAGASVWVKTLEAYRVQLIAYEKYLASTPIHTAPAKEPNNVLKATSKSDAKGERHIMKSHKKNQRSESKEDSFHRKGKEAKISYGIDHSTPVQAWSLDDDEDDSM